MTDIKRIAAKYSRFTWFYKFYQLICYSESKVKVIMMAFETENAIFSSITKPVHKSIVSLNYPYYVL